MAITMLILTAILVVLTVILIALTAVMVGLAIAQGSKTAGSWFAKRRRNTDKELEEQEKARAAAYRDCEELQRQQADDEDARQMWKTGSDENNATQDKTDLA